MGFRVEPITVVYPDGPPHFGKTYEAWSVEADSDLRFDNQDEAERVADRLNKAVDPASITVDRVLHG